MGTPETRLDERFSDPGATAISWEETRSILEDAQLAWISTVHRDGSPHVTPLVPVWIDDILYFTTGPGEQKAVNMASNGRVVVTTGCNDWEEGLDVVVEGRAVRVSNQGDLERLATAWEQKWDGRWKFEPKDEVFQFAGGESLVFEVKPIKVLAFGRDPFCHTTHTFNH
jgi:nitroimidazol reductase NimA-like FMN-containing flavoprotein (pyridoxamine 5'-phosphate oxidase superfamily)